MATSRLKRSRHSMGFSDSRDDASVVSGNNAPFHKYKYGEVVWVSSGGGYPTWPARIDFIPMQMNPSYKTGGIASYPIFCYGTHNLMWLQQDLIYPNTSQNYWRGFG